MDDLATAVGDDFSRLQHYSLSPRGHALFSVASSFVQHLLRASRGKDDLSARTEHIVYNMGLGGHLENPSAILSPEWSRAIRVVATVCSSFSVVGTLATVYWFFMMRRNFRRK
jgi:hypothetical protein